MKRPACSLSITLLSCILCAAASGLSANASSAGSSTSPEASGEQLRFVVIVTRHGVRSPTTKPAKPGKPDELSRYSAQPWPTWSVPPGNLTEHGARLMTLFGTYDRELLASQHLLAPSGCADVPHIRILADSDQRTRETGKALAVGLAPGCSLPVAASPEGTADPLFHSLEAGIGHPDKALAVAALSGRIGANPQALSEAYRPQLQALEAVLQTCPANTATTACNPNPASLFSIPASLTPGNGDHLADLKSPLNLAATMTEDMLLAYSEGMSMSSVGWGQVDLPKLRELLALHTAKEDLADRTPYLARVQSSNLLYHVLQSLTQAVTQQQTQGSLITPNDRLLILVGHDTNLASISGALNLSWLIDGRRDDTPPGGALVFELWQRPGTTTYSVRTYFTAQTLEQMRNATPLNLTTPPERVPVFLPGCSRADMSCDWPAFQQAIQSATDMHFVK